MKTRRRGRHEALVGIQTGGEPWNQRSEAVRQGVGPSSIPTCFSLLWLLEQNAIGSVP